MTAMAQIALLHFIVKIKGYRPEDAKGKTTTMMPKEENEYLARFLYMI